MTNIGLQIYLNLSPSGLDSSEFNAILDCAPYVATGDNSGQISLAAIRLKVVGSNQYARVSSQRIFEIPALDARKTINEGYTKVYVNQQPILFLPDVLLRGLQNIHAMKGDLLTVWPHGKWNPAEKMVRSLGASRNGVIAGFRFKILKSSSELIFLDIFVGVSGASKGHASLKAWCDSFESTDELPLATIVSEIQSRIFSKGTSFNYRQDTDPSIVFRVKWHHEQGKAILSLTIEKVHELSTALTKSTLANGPADPLFYKYEHLVQPLTIEDSASISLCNDYSSVYEVRIGRPHSSSSCQQVLQNILRVVLRSFPDLDILKPNMSRPDVFEDYFSKLLVKACMANDVRAAKELVQSPLSAAFVNSWTSEVRSTSQDFDPLNILRGFRPLHWAVLFGHVGVATVLLEHGADPFSDTWTGLSAVHVAIVMGRVEMIEQMFITEYLSKRSAPPPQLLTCDTLPNFAASFIRSHKVESVLKLLATILDSDGLDSSFAKPNILGESLLHRASAMDNIYAANWSIQWNSELVDLQDKRGRTPLFHAAAAGSIEISRVLLDHGAKVDAADVLGRTPLYVACRHGHHGIVEMLCSASRTFPYSFPSKDFTLGFNAWHFACLSGSPDVLRALQSYVSAADASRTETVEAKRNYFIYPLHIASSNGALECVKVLCEAGFSTTERSIYTLISDSTATAKPQVKVDKANFARTAEEWAAANGHRGVVTYLRAVNYER